MEEAQNPKGTLYHVTTSPNAELIRQNGFDSSFRHAEGGEAAMLAEAILAGENVEDFWVDQQTDEALTREVFNDILDQALGKVSKERGKDLPRHWGSVFFWPNRLQAQFRRDMVAQNNPAQPYEILEVEASKIPCTCYEADIGKSDELFNEVGANLEVAVNCSNMGLWPHDPEEQEEARELCANLDRIAEDYYRGMKPFTGRQLAAKEVICPCDIPKEALVAQAYLEGTRAGAR